jgi:manganese/zinc/iron transport system substrate-binding protein
MVADLVRAIGGEHVEIKQLMGAGVDPHLFKPTRDDVQAILNADIVFYNGLLLEGKMAETLKKASHSTRSFAAAEALPKDILASDPTEQAHPDPHVWMNVDLWSQTAQAIAEELSRFDPEHATDYREQAMQLQEKLVRLHRYGIEIIGCIPADQRVLITSHDAFRYFGEAYSIEVEAVQGISTESETGLNRINQLVDMLVERRIGSVFIESSVPKESIEALLRGAQSRGHTVTIAGSLYSDAMGSDGTYEGTYIGMMDHNLTTIARALGCDQVPANGFRGYQQP